MDPELQKNIKILTRMAILVMVLLAIYLLFTYVFPLIGKVLAYLPVLFLPFILAVLFAIIIEPVVSYVERKINLKRTWAVFISLITVVGGFFYLLFLMISVITKELSRLYPLVVRYSDQIISQFVLSITNLELFYLQLNLPSQVEITIQENMGKAFQALQTVMDNSINFLVQALTMLPSALIFLIIATVATFFISKDRQALVDFFINLLPGRAQPKTMRVIGELMRALVGFLKAYSILITITAIITIVSLKVLQMDYILTIGIIVGICDILPILGPGTVFVPWIIWQIVTGNTRLAISLAIVYILISVVRQFLEPKIVGDNIGLHPLATLISLYVGLQLGGVIGMIMGPVLVVIVMACYRVGVFNEAGWRKDQ